MGISKGRGAEKERERGRTTKMGSGRSGGRMMG
jgi:hypothetical protein